MSITIPPTLSPREIRDRALTAPLKTTTRAPMKIEFYLDLDARCAFIAKKHGGYSDPSTANRFRFASSTARNAAALEILAAAASAVAA